MWLPKEGDIGDAPTAVARDMAEDLLFFGSGEIKLGVRGGKTLLTLGPQLLEPAYLEIYWPTIRTLARLC